MDFLRALLRSLGLLRKPARVVVVGLDNSGKSSLIAALKPTRASFEVTPTVGFARETFALLPLPVVFVHVADGRVDPATGHEGYVPVLSAAFDRESFAALNLDGVDPSSAVESFEHAMVFTKSKGFAPVTPLDPAQLAPAG